MSEPALSVGSTCPDFTLSNQNGEDVTLSSFRGAKAVLVVFYPFAFSGICTGELCAIRDDIDGYQNDDVQVLAISCDPMFSLRAWADDQKYDFPLLSDFWPHGEVSQRYGVFDERAGKSVRGSFLVDRNGVLQWSVVNGPGQARDMGEYKAAVAAL